MTIINAGHGLPGDPEPIRVYVASDPQMGRAERALEHSIRKNVSGPVELHWMCKGRDRTWDGWSDEKWYTDFSCFRFAIPEVAGFVGRAIYMDVDMLVLQDLRELWEMPLHCGVASLSTARTDVMLFDCNRFHEQNWWPSIEAMKPSGKSIGFYRDLIADNTGFQCLDPKWNVLDGKQGEKIKDIGVIHYTNMNTQPWEPHPEKFKYPPHQRPDLALLWWRMYAESLEDAERSSRGAEVPIAACP